MYILAAFYKDKLFAHADEVFIQKSCMQYLDVILYVFRWLQFG